MITLENAIPFIIIAVVAGGFFVAFYRNHQIKSQGIEADAFITRVEEHESTDSDGISSTTYDYYVRYTDQGGTMREALLTNTYTHRNLVIGDRLKIKYLPGKEKYAVMLKND